MVGIFAQLKTALPVWTSRPVAQAASLRHEGKLLAAAAACARAELGADEPTAGELAEVRLELLARSKAGEHIELGLECTPFLQHPTRPNRNFVRFRPGCLRPMGQSGKDTVFLRDHRQRDLEARGGTVLASKMEKDDAGLHWLRQRVLLHEPWAVQRALTGSIDRFSIGWNPTGPVTCSLCKTEILANCWHWPGDVVETEGGKVAIEWIFHKAELLETSAVCVPAVVGTTVDDIRAALAQLGVSAPSPRKHFGMPPRKRANMDELLEALGLSADASEQAALAAVEKLKHRAESAETRLSASTAQLQETQTALAAERAAHEALRAQLAQRGEDDFITAGVQAGKIRPGSKFESALRKLHALDPAAAKEQLEAAPRVTPAGLPRQSDKPQPPEDGPSSAIQEQLASAGIDDPVEFFARYAGRL